MESDSTPAPADASPPTGAFGDEMTSQRSATAALLLVVALTPAALGQGTWTRAAPLPSSRTEVTGAELLAGACT